MLIPIGSLLWGHRPSPRRRDPAGPGQADSARSAGRPSSAPRGPVRAAIPLLLIATLCPAGLHSKTINVPADFPTIRAAVRAAASGDIVDVDDGIYLEDDIVVDKNIRVRAKHPYGVTIYGTRLGRGAVFLIRAAAEIEGFVIKNADIGILQRDSPDVEWTGRDLAFLNMHTAAVSLNDREGHAGRAKLTDIIVDGADDAIETNDAYGVQVSNSLITNCETALAGYNHIFFSVDRTVFCNCRHLIRESSARLKPPANNRISLGPDVRVLDSPELARLPPQDVPAFLCQFFRGVPASSSDRDGRRRILDWFASVILGEICLGRGDYRAARAAYADALLAGEAPRSEELVFRALYGLGRAAEKQEALGEAMVFYERAIQSIKNLRSELPLRIYEEGFFEDKLEIYDAAVSLLYRLHREHPSQGHDRRALRYVEEWKAAGFLESLWRLRFDLKTGLTEESRRDVDSMSQRISRIQARLRDPALSPSDIQSGSSELVQAEKDFNNVLSRIERDKARKTAPSDPRRPDSSGHAIAKRAGDHAGDHARDRAKERAEQRAQDRPEERPEERVAPDTAVLFYAAGEEDTYALMLTARGLRFARIGKTRELRSLVENYLTFLDLDPGESFKGADGGRRLYGVLLSPLLGDIHQGITKLVFIPDGVLCYLPFEALVRDDAARGTPPSRGAGRARFLIEDFQIAYAPSLSDLLKASAGRETGAGKMDLLAVADEEAGIIRGLAPNLSYRFPHLSHAAGEVRGIARFFDPRRSRLLVNAQAGESVFKHLPLSDFRIIHLASHGFFNDDRWWRSALLLRRTPDSDDDGLLQPLELCRLDLDADLVVLSACQTGTGRFSRGEGILGLSGAFMAAGARSVISSLWTVDDESTSLLMTRFYRYLREGMTKAGALRLSKIGMLETSYRHPFYWASFILSGDYDSAIPLEKRVP